MSQFKSGFQQIKINMGSLKDLSFLFPAQREKKIEILLTGTKNNLYKF